jgi:hypothetical protein
METRAAWRLLEDDGGRSQKLCFGIRIFCGIHRTLGERDVSSLLEKALELPIGDG